MDYEGPQAASIEQAVGKIIKLVYILTSHLVMVYWLLILTAMPEVVGSNPTEDKSVYDEQDHLFSQDIISV